MRSVAGGTNAAASIAALIDCLTASIPQGRRVSGVVPDGGAPSPIQVAGRVGPSFRPKADGSAWLKTKYREREDMVCHIAQCPSRHRGHADAK